MSKIIAIRSSLLHTHESDSTNQKQLKLSFLKSYHLCFLWVKTGCNIKAQMFLQYFHLHPEDIKGSLYVQKYRKLIRLKNMCISHVVDGSEQCSLFRVQRVKNNSRSSSATKGTMSVDIIKRFCLHSLRLGRSHQKGHFYCSSETARNREDLSKSVFLGDFPSVQMKECSLINQLFLACIVRLFQFNFINLFHVLLHF